MLIHTSAFVYKRVEQRKDLLYNSKIVWVVLLEIVDVTNIIELYLVKGENGLGDYMTREDQIAFCVKYHGYSWDWYESLHDKQLYAIYLETYEAEMDAYYEGEYELAREANRYDDHVVRSRLNESSYVIDSPDKMPKKEDGTIDFDALNRMYARN